MRFALLALTASCFAQEALKVELIEQDLLLSRLSSLPVENAARATALEQLFEQTGCKGVHLTTQPVKHSKQPNVVCTLPGESTDTVIVGAHFDKTPAGRGSVDNGSGMLLLPALYGALRNQRRHHTFVFAGFTDEEKGLVGSRAFAQSIPKAERSRFRAMVKVDSLGLGPATVWFDHSHPMLIDWFERIGGAMRLQQFQYVNLGQVGDGDSSSFRQIDVPVIDFHSITAKTWPVLHSDRDNMSAVRPLDYFESFRLIAYYLAYLDIQLEATPADAMNAKKKKAK